MAGADISFTLDMAGADISFTLDTTLSDISFALDTALFDISFALDTASFALDIIGDISFFIGNSFISLFDGDVNDFFIAFSIIFIELSSQLPAFKISLS